jgi:uncharacterized protein (TIGR03790 family)
LLHRLVTFLAIMGAACAARAEGLDAVRLGVVFNLDDSSSREIAQYYAQKRGIPDENLVGIHLPASNTITPQEFEPLRAFVLDHLPSSVQSLALVWSRPFAVGCMSVTSAFAAGYRPGFCEPGCARTAPNPLFDSSGWLPADTVGWWPAMLLPSDDRTVARALIAHGIAADSAAEAGTVYLVRTGDASRNVRAAIYPDVEAMFARRLRTAQLSTPVNGDVRDAIAYFTGAAQVAELPRIRFLPGAVADHLTSTGGVLYGGEQMPSLAWIKQGATASYGTVSEPCNHVGKFPNPAVLLRHYVRGETVLEAYWKSVAMPGQGLFIGEPLARPYGSRRRR